MTLLHFRPDFYIGTEGGGNRFPMTRWEVAQTLRLMRRDDWKVSRDRSSFTCHDLQTGEVCTIKPCSQATVGALYGEFALSA